MRVDPGVVPRPRPDRRSAALHRAQVAVLARHAARRRPLAVVDVGSGRRCWGERLVAEFGGPVVGVDRDRGPRVRSGCEAVLARAEALPLADRSVDLVVMVQTAHHLADRRRAFAEAARVLRPDGVLLVADAVGATWHELFPTALAAARRRMPDETEVRDEAASAGLCLAARDRLPLAPARRASEIQVLVAAAVTQQIDTEIAAGLAALAADPERIYPGAVATLLVLGPAAVA
ncbi:class I SAM-dependent methyltransferase [Micromonospora carbonacea]|uniref:class I SAM-dependent methyltransferase n=1 Tax=Micromonospora carbonacea TaxID=47853 RepID=UPI0033C51B39